MTQAELILRISEGASVTHKGRRYWMHMLTNGRVWRWNFWSDHKWPFYHGSITLAEPDAIAAARAFLHWLPFEVKA